MVKRPQGIANRNPTRIRKGAARTDAREGENE